MTGEIASKKPNTAMWRIRRSLGLERKQVAATLGHNGPDTVARYERGEADPSFDNAIRLSLIYGCGLEELFPFKYASFRRELGPKLISVRKITNNAAKQRFGRTDTCSFEDAINDPACPAEYFPHVRDHVTRLAKLLAGL